MVSSGKLGPNFSAGEQRGYAISHCQPHNCCKQSVTLILSYEKGCQGKNLLPAPLGDAGVVTCIQLRLIPHLILRGGIGLVALARRRFQR